MIVLVADSKAYRNTGQYIARITGRDKKYGYTREFVGRKDSNLTKAFIDEPGVYEVGDIDKKGRKDPSWRIILNRPADCPPLRETADADFIQGHIDESELATIARRLDAGEDIHEIVGFQPGAEGKYKHVIRTKDEAKKASVAVTIDLAIESCWATLGALPEREAKKVLAALKLRVSPPKAVEPEPPAAAVESAPIDAETPAPQAGQVEGPSC
jgi:hypothetical protein